MLKKVILIKISYGDLILLNNQNYNIYIYIACLY